MKEIKVARINIEDSFWSDDRFLQLVEKLGRSRAAGSLLIAFRNAQKYWVPLKKPIPKEIFDSMPDAIELVNCGLAYSTETDKSVYIRGSEDQFSWLIQRSNAGKRDRKSQKEINGNQRNSNGKQREATETNERCFISQEKTTPTLTSVDDSVNFTNGEIIEEKNQRPLTFVNGSQPLTLTLPLSLKKEINTEEGNGEKALCVFGIKPKGEEEKNREEEKNEDGTKNKGIRKKEGETVDHLTDLVFLEIFKSYPKRLGDTGRKEAYKKFKKLSESELKDFRVAVNDYRGYCEKTKIVGTQFVKQFSTFMNNWKDIVKDIEPEKKPERIMLGGPPPVGTIYHLG